MSNGQNSTTLNSEDILPSDSVLCRRARHWAEIMKKFEVNDVSVACDVNNIETLYSNCEGDEEENEDDSQFESDLEESDKNDTSQDFKEILDQTLKNVEKRKKIWKETGFDRVLESFCLEEIDNKVGEWLKKHVNYNMNLNDKNHNYDSNLDETKDDNDNMSNISHHNERKAPVFYQQIPRRRQLKKRYYYEVCDGDEDSSLESVDTAKYILSNRKPCKTKTDTMTIKRFRNIRDFREKENNLMYRNSRLSHRSDVLPIIENSSDESNHDDYVDEKYSLSKRYPKRYADKSLRYRDYRDFDSYSCMTALPIRKYNRMFSREYLDEKLRRRKRKKTDKQLRELSVLASVRRTPSPQSSSTEYETVHNQNSHDKISKIHPVKRLKKLKPNTLINELIEKEKSETVNNFQISINEELPNELIDNRKAASTNSSTVSSFQPVANSTEILNLRINAGHEEDNDKSKGSKNSTNSLTTKFNDFNVTVIYSPKFDSTHNKTTIIDGKLKLTKTLLEDTIGKEFTNKLLNNSKKSDILNYELKADSEIIFLPSVPHMSEISSDDDPIDYFCRPQNPQIVEITAEGKYNLFTE